MIIDGEYSVINVGGSGGGGGGGGSPKPPLIAPDTLRSTAIVEVVEAICEGEILGFATTDPLQSVYLDETPLKTGTTNNFESVSVAYRLGTQTQTYIPGTIDSTVASPEVVNVLVKHGSPIIRTIADTTTDAVRITVKLAQLYKVHPTKGDRTAHEVEIQIDAKVSSSPYWIQIPQGGRDIIRGKTESPYERSFQVNLREIDETATSFDIRVTRVSADDPSNYYSEFYWDSYTKLTYAKLRYPNTVIVRSTFNAEHFSSLPARGYKLKGLKVKIPPSSVYNATARTYTGVDWNGSFVMGWTRNPAWIFYDLVTNPRYGLGDVAASAYLDKWNLFTIAKRCDERVPDGFGGTEPRYSLDLFLQQDDDAKKVVLDIASAFDAMAFWSGGAVYTTQDAPKATASLFVPGNVINGRFTYAGSARQVRYTVALVQWNDPADNYRISTEYVEDRYGIERYGYREKTVAAIGCTSRGQAHRLGKRILLTSRLETDTVTFSVGLDGLVNRPGDIIRIADPLRTSQSRLGGRIALNSTATSIKLDASVTLETGITYKIAIIDALGAVVERTITTAASTTSTVTVSPGFATAPDSDLPFIIYDPAAAGKQYRIISIVENENKEDGFYTITGTTYAYEKYGYIDDTVDLPPLPDNPYLNKDVAAPSGLIVKPGMIATLEGAKRYIDISWSKSTDKFLRNYVFTVRVDGGQIDNYETTETSYRILNPIAGTYEITLWAVSILGVKSPSITITYILGEIYAIESVSIKNLELKTGGTEFEGKSIELVWEDDAVDVLGYTTAYSVGPGGKSVWFRDFQIDVYDGPAYSNYLLNGGTLTALRSDFVTEHAYNYTYEKNVQDAGPRRSVAFVVRARDDFGRYSISDYMVAYNPPPEPILASNVKLHAGYQSAIVEYLRPADNDWLGVILFASTTSGFAPDRSVNQVYIGSDTTLVVPALAEGGTYYFRIAAYDAFYNVLGTGTDYTLTGSEFTLPIASIIDALTPDQIKGNLQAALDSAADPLVFNADVFAIKINGIPTAPFIVGQIDGEAAILLDANVGVTGYISANQIKSGQIQATENIVVGDGGMVINGDGSLVVYDGPSTITNRDFALFSAGTLTFLRYINGAYHEYKTLRRVEYGIANSGDTVTLPGYWESQPKIVVSPCALKSYDALYSTSSQMWTISADNLIENPPGSFIWQFDAVAELNFANSSGNITVAASPGTISADSWLSTESNLPTGTAQVLVSTQFSSVKGDGISTYGFYYRSVTWVIQGWNGSTWIDLATKTRSITKAEHNILVTDSNSANTPSITKIRVSFTAFNTNGTKYSNGSNQYNYDIQYPTLNPMSSLPTTLDFTIGISTGSASATVTTPAYTPPIGWDVYQVRYKVRLSHANGAGSSSLAVLKAAGVQVWSHSFGGSGTTYNYDYDTGLLTASAYSTSYWSGTLTSTGGNTIKAFRIEPLQHIVYLRKMIKNSTTSVNKFNFQTYNFNVVGASAIATGSLNYIAIGD